MSESEKHWYPNLPDHLEQNRIRMLPGAPFDEKDVSQYTTNLEDVVACFVCNKPLCWPDDEHRMNSVTEDGQTRIACTNCRPIYSRCQHTDAPDFDDGTLQKVILTVGTEYGHSKTVNFLCCPECKSKFEALIRHPPVKYLPMPAATDTLILPHADDSRRPLRIKRHEFLD